MSVGIAAGFLVQQSLATYPLFALGTEAQKKRYLEPALRGEKIGAFALTEPGAGSDAAGIKTTARREGDHYVINGAKTFITNGTICDYALVVAYLDPTKRGEGMAFFIVDRDNPGFAGVKKLRKMGQHSSDTAEIVFENCRVPAGNMIGDEGQGYRIALSGLEGGRIGIASQSVGMARAAFEAALAYAKEREAFGKPIFEHQAVNFRLADMATRLEAARQLILHAATLKDAGRPCLKEAAMAKLFASEMAEKVCSDAIQIHGGYGYVADFPVERLWRDVRVTQIYEGASDIQRMVIGRTLQGE